MKLSNIIPKIMGLDVISTEELNKKIQNESVTVFDVNSQQSWMQNRVPGAQNLEPTGFTASDLPIDKSLQLVFYCSNPMCRKAPNTALKVKKMGFQNVMVMPDGINGWLNAGLPTEKGKA